MNRFSEDIDLTVKVNGNESNSSNKTRLKKSALGYSIDGLKLVQDETIDKKGSITSFYKYDSLFNLNELFKSERIQIEATSFTVSEPVSIYIIEPLIYKYATKEEKSRLGGISEAKNIVDFEYMKLEFNDNLINSFNKMQRIYVLDDENIITIDDVKYTIKTLLEVFRNL